MDKLEICGGRPLHGKINISGAKNAALPALFACLLTEEPCHLTNVPQLRDIHSALAVLRAMGVHCETNDGSLKIQAAKLHTHEAPYTLVKTMRASILALGPLLARFGQAIVSLPGGFAIGARPVNAHIEGLTRMGATIEVKDGNIVANAERLRGAHLVLPMPTVTGTENLMMAAALADGETIIENAAREPEITDLAIFLNSMGANITGLNSNLLRIRGTKKLSGASHTVVSDRIEAGTYLCATAACGGDVELVGANAEHLQNLLNKLETAGATLAPSSNNIRIVMSSRPQATDAETAPYPGFPTDLQAQWMAVNSVADGTAIIVENVFENRFMHAPELTRMGANIELKRNTAIVRGVDILKGAPLMATDLRASASLVIAGLAAQDTTLIDRVYHLDRGYERMEHKLSVLGAKTRRCG
ncbi:UDP-N-acetylglucosamine 1-carboxyvinyltransferase [Candidatus Persebacteraceae bacterium Df01]|jgi:UDP-N-acetylglucosamine 1-carboxyvinyltransferase|uniref:UDP-N-acetylglucosamine 1-carboxyvinyltransferase n=1 Tax=Candidatus Doriopsillibacter californiensis TaxID=2970740 RepID=A0ABT7QKY3_9GAMM|nr:UDP-N-acetylglucosamine 1-carboxyvinyltransferase [Candidatus Persebacteraceae bacterium Df01]